MNSLTPTDGTLQNTQLSNDRSKREPRESCCPWVQKSLPTPSLLWEAKNKYKLKTGVP